MKIGHLDKLPAATPVAQERKPAAGETAPGAGTARNEASAQVELSSAAALLGGGATVAEFDAEKVERIAQAIRDGKFTVNAEAIADKLIANAQELLGRSAH